MKLRKLMRHSFGKLSWFHTYQQGARQFSSFTRKMTTLKVLVASINSKAQTSPTSRLLSFANAFQRQLNLHFRFSSVLLQNSTGQLLPLETQRLTSPCNIFEYFFTKSFGILCWKKIMKKKKLRKEYFFSSEEWN